MGMKQEIYLDNAATTPVVSDVVEQVTKCLINDYGNPSSLHKLGANSEKKMKEQRRLVANLLRVDEDDITFTSGGTESNNLAVFGTVRRKKRYGNHLITTTIEHPSILRTFQYLEEEGWNVTYLPVDKYGVVRIEALEEALNPETILVSIMHVNNEIGSIQPVERISKLIKMKSPNAVFHVDAVQSFGRIDVRPLEWEADLVSVSGHKIHAPKGIGALYIKKGVSIMPLQWGGNQERGIRSGTENLPGIVGFGEAAKWVSEKIKNDRDYLYRLKQILVSGILEQVPEAVFNGPKPEDGAPHILNISIPGIRGEVLLHVLESNGVFVSTGSACSSRRAKVSHVLEAIGAPRDIAEGAIRISLSYLNNEDEMKIVPGILRKSIDQVKHFKRR